VKVSVPEVMVRLFGFWLAVRGGMGMVHVWLEFMVPWMIFLLKVAVMVVPLAVLPVKLKCAFMGRIALSEKGEVSSKAWMFVMR